MEPPSVWTVFRSDPSYIIDLTLIGIIIVFTMVLMIMIVLRRELQPLKVKNWALILCSVFGCSLIIISNLGVKIIKNYTTYLNVWFIEHDKNPGDKSDDEYLRNVLDVTCMFKTCHSCIFTPLLILPYFFRAYKLSSIFIQQNKYAR